MKSQRLFLGLSDQQLIDAKKGIIKNAEEVIKFMPCIQSGVYEKRTENYVITYTVSGCIYDPPNRCSLAIKMQSISQEE